MANYSENDSVFNEPHFHDGPHRSDPSENKAGETFGDKGDNPKITYDSGDSIYDEPDIFPGRGTEPIDRDWSCSNCGYNLRGLPTGHLCPECGQREWYRPSPPDKESYQKWLQERLSRASVSTGWFIAFFAAVCGGFMAILASFMETQQSGPAGLSMIMIAAIFAPAVEETMKIAAAAFIVEVCTYLIRRIGQLQLATIGAAFIFAAIENLIYLDIYIPNPGTNLILWRWTVCVALHLGCTIVASRGLIEVWKRTVTEYRPPQITRGIPMLITAIVIHSFYNICAILYGYVS